MNDQNVNEEFQLESEFDENDFFIHLYQNIVYELDERCLKLYSVMRCKSTYNASVSNCYVNTGWLMQMIGKGKTVLYELLNKLEFEYGLIKRVQNPGQATKFKIALRLYRFLNTIEPEEDRGGGRSQEALKKNHIEQGSVELVDNSEGGVRNSGKGCSEFRKGVFGIPETYHKSLSLININNNIYNSDFLISSFEKIWSIYPHDQKNGKSDIAKSKAAFTKLEPNEETVQKILCDIELRNQHDRKFKGGYSRKLENYLTLKLFYEKIDPEYDDRLSKATYITDDVRDYGKNEFHSDSEKEAYEERCMKLKKAVMDKKIPSDAYPLTIRQWKEITDASKYTAYNDASLPIGSERNPEDGQIVWERFRNNKHKITANKYPQHISNIMGTNSIGDLI